MKKTFLKLLFLFLATWSQAQMATICDSDGYTNVRLKPSKTSSIIGTIRQGQPFLISPMIETDNKNWTSVWIPINPDPKIKDFIRCDDVNTDGYIANNRISIIENMKPFKIKEINSNKFIFSNNNIEIIVEVQKFEASKHKIKHKTAGDDQGLIIDDCANFWGFYNQIPRNEIKSIVLKSKNYTYTFPEQAICGLYEVTLEYCRIYSGKNNEIFIHLPGGDGADGYSACWNLKKNKLFAMTVLATVP